MTGTQKKQDGKPVNQGINERLGGFYPWLVAAALAWLAVMGGGIRAAGPTVAEDHAAAQAAAAKAMEAAKAARLHGGPAATTETADTPPDADAQPAAASGTGSGDDTDGAVKAAAAPGSMDEEARPSGDADQASRSPANIDYHAAPADPDEEEEDVGAAQKAKDAAAAAAVDASRNAFELEILGFHDYKSVAALRRQLETVIERNSPLMKKRSSWGAALYQFRTGIDAKQIQTALMGTEFGEGGTRLKSVSFNNNRFTVEVQ
ncbi:MAG TPA: hypothetical protein VL588_03105 [Bdellovibrionota bacterium]|jgi:hypothetical protein|nr:hypothetical protein [Bdellovibrionota bacterium]